MAKKMKYHPHGSVLFITFAIEQGILLLSNPLGRLIVKGCLARALFLHPIRISHLIVNATHIHIIAVVENPDDVHLFMQCFKTESAHYINRLLGRNKRTVWCEGYDSPIVLTPIRALVAICYLYANPAKDDLEECIEAYPGFSTWGMFIKGQVSLACKRLYRPLFTVLARDSHNLRGYTKRAEAVAAEATETHDLTIEPNAWMEAFGLKDTEAQRLMDDRILARVRRLEERAAKVRQRKKKSVIGREALLNQKFDLYRLPKRSGKRMWCLSESRAVRVRFIRYFKALMVEAREVRRQWQRGDLSVPYPPGLFPPSAPKLANVLSVMGAFSSSDHSAISDSLRRGVSTGRLIPSITSRTTTLWTNENAFFQLYLLSHEALPPVQGKVKKYLHRPENGHILLVLERRT